MRAVAVRETLSVLVAAVLAAVVPHARSAVAAAEPVWHRVDTPNFVVIGTAGERSLAEVGLQFEGFREALSRLVSPTATATAVPTIVVVFPNDKAFEPFRPVFNGKRVDLAGRFLSRADVNYVLIGPNQRGDGWRVVFHEYTHLIVSNVTPNLPPWLNEGLAEYYSSFELRGSGRQVLLGLPIPEHYRELGAQSWLSIPELIGTTHESPQYNEGSRRTVFYAESWLLTHMLLHGQPDRRARLSAYIAAVASNTTPQAAWEKVFAGDDVSGDLRRYLTRPSIASRLYTLSDQIARASGQPAVLTPAAAEATFGELFLAQGDKEAAAARFRKALALEPSSARAAIGAAEAAGEAIPAVRVLPSDDWLGDYMIAAAMVRDSRNSASSSAAVALLQHAARRHPLGNMYGLIAEAAADNGMLSAADVQGLRLAHESAPARDDYSLALARALATNGQYADARNVLGAVIAHPYWKGSRETALQMMRWVLDREQWSSAPADAYPETERDVPNRSESEPAIAAPAAPERDVEPLYRDVQPGEHRLEGLLEQVACAPGKPTVVTVRYADRVVRYQASQLTDIEFITYESTRRGRFSCGPRVPPDPVYLTWKPSGRELDTVVAVEFLPKVRRQR